MSSHPPSNSQPLYPQVLQSNPDAPSSPLSTPTPNPSSSSSLYPSVDMDNIDTPTHNTPIPPSEQTLLSIPGAILHLIDKRRSIQLSTGDLSVLLLTQGPNAVAALARVSSPSDSVQWPLTRDAAAVKLDHSHYFFALRFPGDNADADLLNYGLTFASKGQESLLHEFDAVLDVYCNFSVQKVNEKVEEKLDVLDASVAKEVAPLEIMEAGSKKEMMEERSAAYWTTLAPNVEDYSGLVAKGIALGSGQIVKGILWCGDVTVDRIRWGNELMKQRMGPNGKPTEISEETLTRIQRVKKVTKMSEKVAVGILTGVVKVSGFFTSSVVNSKAGKKFFGLLPGEILLASLEGFGKICDAVEVSGKNVLSTSSTVTTGLVSHRYGDQAAEATNHSLDAAGHALGTAWAAFKIRKAFDPKSALKPTTLTKSALKAAAAEIKAKQGK